MSFTKIKGIDELIKSLNMGPGYEGYAGLLESIEFDEHDWRTFTRWMDNRYTRNCIASCDSYELLLMCWQKGHTSPIHNYDSQEGWIKVLQGELTIDYYDIDRKEKCGEKTGSQIIKEGEFVCLTDDFGFHKVTNSSSGNTISLHINIEAVKEWEVFQEFEEAIIKVKPLLDFKNFGCD